MGIYFSQIVQTIKTYPPAAKIAIDVSPWITDVKGWYTNFGMSLVDYASTSGGRTLAGSAKIHPVRIYRPGRGVREIATNRFLRMPAMMRAARVQDRIRPGICR